MQAKRSAAGGTGWASPAARCRHHSFAVPYAASGGPHKSAARSPASKPGAMCPSKGASGGLLSGDGGRPFEGRQASIMLAYIKDDK